MKENKYTYLCKEHEATRVGKAIQYNNEYYPLTQLKFINDDIHATTWIISKKQETKKEMTKDQFNKEYKYLCKREELTEYEKSYKFKSKYYPKKALLIKDSGNVYLAYWYKQNYKKKP